MRHTLTLGLEPGPFVKVRVEPGDASGLDIDLDDIADVDVRRAIAHPNMWTAIALRWYLCGHRPSLARLEAIEQQFDYAERLMRGRLDS